MGITAQAKLRFMVAALALFPLFAMSEPGSTMMPGQAPAPALNPAAPPVPPRVRGQFEPKSETSQADAFSTAGEQAAFLGAYQMSFGPYGKSAQSAADREKFLRETAEAIQTCISGGACQEEKVLKALVQYNMGQEVRRQMLTNNTNRENLRSLDNSDDPLAVASNAVLNQKNIEQTRGQGKDFEYDTTGVDPIKTGKVVELRRGSSTTKQPYFQLAESDVIDLKGLTEREILGDEFVRNYRTFMGDFTRTKNTAGKIRGDESRFYKIVPAKAESQSTVYAPNSDKGPEMADPERFREVQAEQDNPHVRKMVDDYLAKVKAPTVEIDAQGNRRLVDAGINPQVLGFSHDVDIDPAKMTEVNFKDLAPNGKLENINRPRALVRLVNKNFRDTAEMQDRELAAAAGQSRDPASGPAPSISHNIYLDPVKFGDFLEEIWPSAKTRAQRLQTPAPALTETPDADPAADPAPPDTN